VRLPRGRIERWLEVLQLAERAAALIAARLGRATVILYGSYARGDFNLWSDVDLIIVSEAFEGVRPLDRYDLIQDLLPPGFQAVPLTPEELAEALARPAWRQALSRGAAMVRDDYGLARLVAEAAGRAESLAVLAEKVRRAGEPRSHDAGRG